ncbi:hypothetical protein ACMDB5_10485 [Flavobacterium sp. W1B]|uniref:hypothetical protein n=1 Tax=Flavobacterium sp. W1B TaxID=3394146 RepID=UPI0039BD0D4A
MTGNQFEIEIILAGQPLKIIDQKITNKVDLKNNIIATGVIIENCIFDDVVIFQDIDLNCGIKFINCIFKKSFSLNNCKAENYEYEFNFNNSHLEFSNTTIEGLYFNGENEIQRGIDIQNNSIINSLKVETIICSIGSFQINDSTVNNQFDIRLAKIINNISIRGNSFINSKIRFENIQVNSFIFTDAKFNDDIYIWAGKVENLIFNDGEFNDDLFITAVPISQNLTVIGTVFKKSITFNLWDETNKKQGTLNKVHISSAKFGEQFIINGNNYEINEIVIKVSKQLEGALYFNSSNILNTKISGDNYNSNIVFNHCNFNNLIFDFFYNYSTLSIISAKSFGKNSIITIAHSNLGKFHFFNVFFNTFEKIKIFNSVLTEIITANVKWFDDNKLNTDSTTSHHTFEQKKEIYRQLKYALDKQGNRISSLHFKALEMRTYKQESFIKVKWYKRIFNINRFVLWVGQTNDFGLNWLKPVLLSFLFLLIFHFLIIVGISDELSYSINLNYCSLNRTWVIYSENFSSLPQLMNPTHILSRIYPKNANFSFIVHFLDYFLKIILAFFIFQTVSAFRKYMK